MLEASDQFWGTAANELERLLVVRIDGFKTKLWSALAVTLAATLLALLFAWSLSRSIIRAIRGLVAGVGELTEGDMSGAGAACGRPRRDRRCGARHRAGSAITRSAS